VRKLYLFICLFCLAAVAQTAEKPGVERWPVKTSVPGGKIGRAQTVDLSKLLALGDVAGVTKNDKRYQTVRIPSSSGMEYPEGAVITTTGWLHLVAGETDGDYHIQISASAASGDDCLIVEVPNPDPQYTSDPGLRPVFESVRSMIKAKMLAGKDPSPSGSVMQHPPYVTVTGILFYDDSHVGDPPRGKKGMKAATLWELHPVSAMTFAKKPQE